MLEFSSFETMNQHMHQQHSPSSWARIRTRSSMNQQHHQSIPRNTWYLQPSGGIVASSANRAPDNPFLTRSQSRTTTTTQILVPAATRLTMTSMSDTMGQHINPHALTNINSTAASTTQQPQSCTYSTNNNTTTSRSASTNTGLSSSSSPAGTHCKYDQLERQQHQSSSMCSS
jgi:hypothetical protein